MATKEGSSLGNGLLAGWNALEQDEAVEAILPCCGSRGWARSLAAQRPFATEETLYLAADVVWSGLDREGWMAAFASHPRIGQRHAEATAKSLTWSAGEQDAAMKDVYAKAALAEGNQRYEERFGRTFIVCATGKTAGQMLGILERRMTNDPEAEWLEAAEQQRQITQLRLKKWLGGE